ncbi:MAG: LUD domain-containing protein [Bacteroidetes bacterium]|nr:LUD domain-containing protein [Bacteroidota bacterium]
MARNISSKEAMLTNIRKALLSPTKAPFSLNEPMDPAYPVSEEPLEIQFAQELIKVNGEFIFCETEKECVDSLKELIAQKGWKKISCVDKSLLTLFDRNVFTDYETDKNIIQTEVSLTPCEALVARTGSVLFSSRLALGRTLPVFPPYNIVIASTNQLVLDISDAFALVRKKYDGSMPSMVNLATGPSRTADIEKTLVLGAHCPRAVYVLLIDNWVTETGE